MDEHDYRDQRGLATLCIGLLIVQALLAAFGAVSDYWIYALDEATSLRNGAADDARVALVAAVQTLFYFIGGIAILVWLYRANRNAHLIGTLEMEVSPGWAVGWFFVPFANLFMPYRAVSEVWAASGSAVPGAARPPLALLIGWWLCWLGTNITGLVSMRMGLDHPDDFGVRHAAAGVDMASNILLVAACLALAAIVAGIQSLQNRAAPTH